MTFLRFCFVACLCFLTVDSAAQDDDTIRYVEGLPITGEDTVTSDQKKTGPSNNHVTITREQVPPGLLKTLAENTLFINWESEEILFDRNTDLYWIHFQDSAAIRSYAFAEDGAIVSVREKDIGQ